MERTPVPTAPGERAKWQTHNPPKRIGWLLLTLLLSLVTGFSGAILAGLYQDDTLQFSTPDLIVVPDNTSSGSAKIISSLQEQQADALVLLTAENLSAIGVILSSDGWIVTAADIKDQASVTVITNTERSYLSDQIVYDEVTGLSYVHIAQTGLRVAQFRNVPTTLGENLVAYGRLSTGDSAAFTAVAFTDESSERLSLDRTLPTVFLGAPLYDLDYAIVGFATDTADVIPIGAVNEVAYDLFTTGAIVRTN